MIGSWHSSLSNIRRVGQITKHGPGFHGDMGYMTFKHGYFIGLTQHVIPIGHKGSVWKQSHFSVETIMIHITPLINKLVIRVASGNLTKLLSMAIEIVDANMLICQGHVSFPEGYPLNDI